MASLAASQARGTKRSREATDAAVPEGSAVLFDANLLHAAHPHARRSEQDDATSERVAFHYIPTAHDGGFRGQSFARGAFADPLEQPRVPQHPPRLLGRPALRAQPAVILIVRAHHVHARL